MTDEPRSEPSTAAPQPQEYERPSVDDLPCAEDGPVVTGSMYGTDLSK
jgi:hypothetical protein